MTDILNPLSVGKTAQNAIDNFIDLWLTGLDILTGGDPNENTKAPMPFYCAGRGTSHRPPQYHSRADGQSS